MKSELTKYTYEQEREMIAAHQEDFDAERIYFLFDEQVGRWRKVTK